MSRHHTTVIVRITAIAMAAIIGGAGPLVLGSGMAHAASSSSSSKVPTAPGMPVFGATGPAVVAVEKAIMRNGFTLPKGAIGVFDKRLLAVLKTFQRVVGLRVTGVVDAATAKVLKLTSQPETTTTAVPAAPAPTPAPAPNPGNGGFPLSTSTLPAPGAKGDNVVLVQQALISRGFAIKGGADGKFGNATRTSLRKFQKSRKLPVTGRVNVRTARALGLVAPAVQAPLPTSIPASALPVVGQKGDYVKVLQNALIAAGIPLKGGADGIFGAATTTAIRSFQSARQLAVTGKVDLRTAITLGITERPAVFLDVFPVQGPCSFSNTWQAPRSDGRRHEGVDIIAPTGNLVYAVKDGTITRLYSLATDKRAGNGVRLTTDDGTYFFYAHFSRIADGIQVGTKVKAGQVIGYIGSTGASSGPHLHLEVHPQGGAAVDPTPYVAAVNACHVTAPLPQG